MLVFLGSCPEEFLVDLTMKASQSREILPAGEAAAQTIVRGVRIPSFSDPDLKRRLHSS